MFFHFIPLKKNFILFFLLLSIEAAFSQSPRIFSIQQHESEGKPSFAFISLSDLLICDSDTFPFPFPDISAWPKDSSYKFSLPRITRIGLFKQAGISESDMVWIYDYASNHLLPLPVKTLPLVALLNPYENWENGGFEPSDYMLGFELGLKEFPQHQNNLHTSLAAISKSNPFDTQGLQKVQWKSIPTEQFPGNGKNKPTFWATGATVTGTFSSDYSNVQVYVQTLQKQSSIGYHYLIRSKSKAELIEDFYIQSSESSEPAPLNQVDPNGSTGEQWIGTLIKGQPPVLLGLEYYSFSCPKIHVLKKGAEPWWIFCDCRH